ncbi:Sodium:dicarboxylate symporter [Amylocarpus encephaloides]|uniref:Amino acid transporter n=1 Tax=Amylocarpus encephaloides TaxID=45428 RepID=A0A9P7YE32_9HELO|nr:Sodium:dicarboxylate symporter [Amylocarpus encephaloides]
MSKALDEKQISDAPVPEPVLTAEKLLDSKSSDIDLRQETTYHDGDVEKVKKPWWNSIKEPGSALQIVVAAALAIAIGVAVTASVDDVPEACSVILAIPGTLWLRALKAVVLPLIVTAMILAVQSLKDISRGGATLARYTIGYYICTTLIAIVHSTILTSLVWAKLMVTVSSESQALSAEDQEMVAEREDVAIHDVVVQMFESLIPSNVVNALATDSLLAVLVTSVVVGYLVQPNGSILRAVKEIEKIITIIITFLIKLAPIGVFFLILPNLFRLDLAEIGVNLGILIGASISNMAIHLFIVFPAIFFLVTRTNPYLYWFKNSPSWITAWGTASSAATMPVTLKVAKARGIPDTISKFSIPLGTLINMDGTAIYFPIVVTFLAETQGITLSAADYVIIVLLSTLASIGTTPIPSSSLVLTVMIAGSVNIPITGMYAVVVAIDWFLDRFRTMVNVSSDLYGAKIVHKITGIEDPEGYVAEEEVRRGEERV